MGATILREGQLDIGHGFPALDPGEAAPGVCSRKQIRSLGILYAHALAIEHEEEAGYREFATLVADYGNDTVADLLHGYGLLRRITAN